MAHLDATVFAQMTDLHVGDAWNPQEALFNLQWALREIAGMRPKPSLILVTADIACAGRARELEVYAEAVKASAVPLYALPANHDLWGEKDTQAWERLVGPLRQRVDAGGLSFVLWDDIQRRDDGKGWKALMRPTQREWLEGAFKESRPTSWPLRIVRVHVAAEAMESRPASRLRRSVGFGYETGCGFVVSPAVPTRHGTRGCRGRTRRPHRPRRRCRAN